MRILCIADHEDPFLWDYWTPANTRNIDLIISAGDLNHNYLEFLTTVVNKPLLYVHGNHDERYDVNPPEGCMSIENAIYNYHGLRIMGLGGSHKYRDGKYMFTEKEMAKRVHHMKRLLKHTGGIDIFVSHAPCAGYGDLEDLPHQGFDCFNELLDTYHPRYMIHGHIHKEYIPDFQPVIIHPSGTKIINASEKFILEINEDEYPPMGHTGQKNYDKEIIHHKNILLR